MSGGGARLRVRRRELDTHGGVVGAVEAWKGLQGVDDILGRGRVGNVFGSEATEGQRKGATGRGAGKLLLLVVLLAVGILIISASRATFVVGEKKAF